MSVSVSVSVFPKGQSARMAWKWDGDKGKAGVPEKEGDYYRRRMSRWAAKRQTTYTRKP